MRRFQVMLDKDTEQGMKSLDDGNLSGGIRKAWQRLKPLPLKTPLRMKQKAKKPDS